MPVDSKELSGEDFAGNWVFTVELRGVEREQI